MPNTSQIPIGRVTALFAVVLGIHCVLSVAWTTWVTPRHRAAELDRIFLERAPRTEILVAGDSHARNAVDPEVLGRALNIAVGGETYIKTTFRLPWLLDQAPETVSTVVLGLDHVSLSGWKVDAWEPESVWGRYADWGLLAQVRGRPFAYAARWVKSRLAPYAGELDTAHQLFTATRAFQDETDRNRFARQPARFMRRAGREAADLHLGGQVHLHPAQLWAFERMVEDLRDRGIRVVLVAYPVSRAYLARLDELGVAAPQTRPEVQPILAREGVDFLDFSHRLVERPEAFYDADHLNGMGRKWFSRQLRMALAR